MPKTKNSIYKNIWRGGHFSRLNFKSGPGSGLKIKFFSGSEKPGSKISRPCRRARALISTMTVTLYKLVKTMILFEDSNSYKKLKYVVFHSYSGSI